VDFSGAAAFVHHEGKHERCEGGSLIDSIGRLPHAEYTKEAERTFFRASMSSVPSV
jgi:hypothetical protein